ncbi:Testican-2 [Bagarius yarrelli]|uniref:Testican-2 n=1 Tax=Bagarius yarrelli TaxID=175774 RepID=A0A556TJC2_BAGYA|nr:Testican-2 [Bagarius yarrelli]
MAGLRSAVLFHVLLFVFAGCCGVQGAVRSGKEPDKTGGNFLEDEQWLSTISQYSRKMKHWNRFRDDDYVRSVDDPQGSEENILALHGYLKLREEERSALVLLRIRQSEPEANVNSCKPCPLSSSDPVCGSDGHNYASQCKLDQQACLSGKTLTIKCAGPCPCVNEPVTKPKAETHSGSKTDICTGQDFADLGDRLRDWFQLLHGNAKMNSSGRQGSGTALAFAKNSVAGCKDSIGWMFSKLDTSNDLYLDHSELAAINLEKYEVCIMPFFNSCDSYHDGKVSMAEWCLCFWREKPACLAEIGRLQVKEVAKRKPGMFIPNCDEDGYYKKLQCDQSSAECWCVDLHGTEIPGSRVHGKPDCDELVGSSGDFGSGVGWEDEEDKETEENAEEAEEEEEPEPEDTDDGGYIW